MIGSWYYAKEVFPYQEALCKAVEWIAGYNLEGRRLVSTTLAKPDGTKTQTWELTGEPANPLTIRLHALDEALKYFDNAKTIDKKIKELTTSQLDKNKFSGMSGTWHGDGSSLNTRGAPIEIMEIAGETLEIRHIDIHLALYEFFTNFGSVIDRLAYEINLLYALIIPMVDWPKLTYVEQGEYKKLRDLDAKDAELTRFIKSNTLQFTKAIGYRNRLVHDGIIRVYVGVHSFSGLSIMLAEDCNKDTSPMNVEAISFCEWTKDDVLKLLNGSYKLMFQHLQSCGKPPW